MKKANRFAVLALCILLLAGGLPAAVLAEADPTPDAVLAETPAPAEPSSEMPPEDMAALVTLPEYMSEEGDVSWRITDDDPNSRIRVKARYDITLFVPEGAALLRLSWYESPEKVQIKQLDGAGEILTEETLENGPLTSYLTPVSGCKQVQLKALKAYELSGFRFYDAETAAAVGNPEEIEKADLLIIAAHTGDEQLYFSGIAPMYDAERCLHTVSVFLSSKNRLATENAMQAAAAAGQKAAPVFIGREYRLLSREYQKEAESYWRQSVIVKELVDVIRRYRPEVIVTHAAEGEEEEAMHACTAAIVEAAIEEAAHPKRGPKSLKLYGPWQVKKLYEHCAADTAGATLLPIDEPLCSFDGKTGREVAEERLLDYAYLGTYHKHTTDSAYRLVYTEVGEDSAKNDLFEHIDPSSLTNVGAVLPTPSPVPTPEATPEPTPVPTQEPAAEPAAAAVPDMQQTPERGRTWLLPAVAAGIGLLATLFLAAWRILATVRRSGKKPTRLFCILPLLLMLVIAAVLYYLLPGERDAAQITAEPTLAPTPVQTPAPDMEQETAEPAPETTPHPWEEYFARSDGSDEQVVWEEENGHWEYRSEDLSVIIDRHEKPEAPLVWYIAHIRMRNVDAFRPGFGYFDERGSAKIAPWKLARTYRAVLAITGDNLINSEKGLKGVLIRNGKVYAKGKAQPTLAICPDMTLRIYERGVSADTILEDGVQNTFGFGPALVRDGAVAQEECSKHSVRFMNPRAGLGMIEPGHYVAIVVDGRQKEYSIGVTLLEYAEMFVNEGCTVAYNMDGGISAGIVFMGENLNQHKKGGNGRISSQRPWPDALLFGYSETVPTLDDPIYNTGNLDEKIPRN